MALEGNERLKSIDSFDDFRLADFRVGVLDRSRGAFGDTDSWELIT